MKNARQPTISSYFARQQGQENRKDRQETTQDDRRNTFAAFTAPTEPLSQAADTTSLDQKRPKDASPGPTTPKKAIRESAFVKKFSYHKDGEGSIDGASQTAIQDAATLQDRARRHERFVARFSHVSNGEEFDPIAVEENGSPMEDESQMPSNDMSFKRSGSTIKTPPGKRVKTKDELAKYTPLERQYMEIKSEYPDALLVIEVGYKYRFFGEDAVIASRILGIVHYLDHNFHTASIPVHRLQVHVRRLVHAGYKVGVVKQIETAALKAAGDNRNAPFVRRLTNLYSKGTFVDDMLISEIDEDSFAGSNTGTNSNYLMCLVEERRGGSGPDEKVKIGMVAVQPSTGDIVYDSFDDGYMRTELETRILHLQPCELLLPTLLSKASEKLVSHISLNRKSAFSTGEGVRIERSEAVFSDYNSSFTYVSSFYAKDVARKEGEPQQETMFAEILRFPENIVVCLAALLRYLEDFGIQHVFKLTKFFQPFSARSHMLLNGNTLANLEIYLNQTYGTENGSLFWILNHTSTTFGRRLLKRWVGRPLVDVDALNARVNAVEEILDGSNGLLDRARELLKHLPDLERGLCRVHYGKSSSSELLQILNALQRCGKTFPLGSSEEPFKSPVLNEIIDLFPVPMKDVNAFLAALDIKAAESEDKYNLFKDESRYPEIQEHKKSISEVEQRLEHHLANVRRELQKPTLQYSTVSGIEYLIEIKNTESRHIPRDWVKISSTKAVGRYHTPTILELTRLRDQHKERLSMACDQAYASFLSEISDKYEILRDLVGHAAMLDCLFSLATVACQPGYVKPTFVDTAELQVVNGRHPIVEQTLVSGYVPNDIHLHQANRGVMILTGPNMGGKSSYIRQVALIAIMGQIGSYVPAESARLGILDAVYTRMGASDNMLAGESTFMVELHETSDIMKQATPRSLVILDELGRGTSTHDGIAIAYATLKHFIEKIQSITLFVTHYPSLSEFAHQYPSVINAHMGFIESEQEGEKQVTFLYRLTDGVAKRSYGLNVARLANIPQSILATAEQRSAEMEAVFQARADAFVRAASAKALQEIIQGHVNMDDLHKAQRVLQDQDRGLALI